jgi:hypothetical protein
MHSWRVLILPYLEQGALYNAYNFNEPWNGPNNSKLASQMPRCFRCPSDARMPEHMTSYFCVMGPGRLKYNTPLKLGDVEECTILLVESKTARVNWLEPRDFAIDEVVGGDDPQSRAASSYHRYESAIWRTDGWFHVALYDCSIRPLHRDIDADTLRALLTIDRGGKAELLYFEPIKRLRPEFVTLVSLTAAFVVLAIIRRLRMARRWRAPVQSASRE